MDNVHPETNIPFGVVSANDVPYLQEQIFANGDDLNYKAALKETQDRLKACTTVAEVNAVVDDMHYNDDYHVDDMEFDLEELAGNLMETWECDENYITYENDGYKYTLSGNYIFVRESPYCATCRPCSPCFPNAGDLGSITEESGGNVAYCFDPEDYRPDDPDRPKFVINEETTPATISLPDED